MEVEMIRYLPTTDTFREQDKFPKGNLFEGIKAIEKRMDEDIKKTELPEPIKFEDEVPESIFDRIDDVFYFVSETSLCPINKNTALGDTLENLKDCYRTLDEAVQVAKEKWGIK